MGAQRPRGFESLPARQSVPSIMYALCPVLCSLSPGAVHLQLHRQLPGVDRGDVCQEVNRLLERVLLDGLHVHTVGQPVRTWPRAANYSVVLAADRVTAMHSRATIGVIESRTIAHDPKRT